MAVIRRGTSRDGWYAFPEEGSSFFIPPAVAQELSLKDGQTVSGEELHKLQDRCLSWQARSKAVELLARREHSRRELEQKLIQRGYSQETISRVLDGLEERGYLDDRRFAESWVGSRIRRKPEGKRKLASGLAAKGVHREIIEEVLQGVDTRQLLTAAYEQLEGKAGGDREKLLRSLAARGFAYQEIRRFFEERGIR